MKQQILRLWAGALCCALLLCGCTRAQAPSSGASAPGSAFGAPAAARRTVPFGQMQYERPDFAGIQAQLQELNTRLAAAEDLDEVLALEAECNALAEGFTTMYALASIHNYLDVNDPFYEEEVRVLGEASVDLTLCVNAFYQTLLDDNQLAGPWRGAVGEYVFAATQNDLLFLLDSVAALARERRGLEADYNQYITTLAVRLDGRDYTLFDIYEVDSSTLYHQLLNLYYDKHLATFGRLYARLVQIDKETAYALGFADAASMYYLQHRRDYTPAAAEAVCAAVKETFVPLLGELPDYSGQAGPALAEAMEAMPGALAALGEELVPAWQYMLQNELVSPQPRTGKANIAFTLEVPGYDAPYLLMNWSDDVWGVSTLAHEFGHFYEFYLHYADDVVFNLDVAEIYSTTLELLMLEQYGAFFADAGAARLQALGDFAVNSVVYQCLLEEFQLKIYALDAFDAGMAGRLFADLLDEYGLGEPAMRDASGGVGDWIGVEHLFTTPFYTISYVASGVAALQVWQRYRQNPESGMRAYFDMLHAEQNQSYTALLQAAGLRPVTDASTLREAAAAYREVFGLSGALPAAA